MMNPEQNSGMRAIMIGSWSLLLFAVCARAQRPAAPSVASSPAARAESTTVTVPAGTMLFAQLQRPLRTRTARLGDSVYLQITFPVTVRNEIVIPAATYAVARLDSLARHGWFHPTVELQLHVVGFLFANGYVVPVSEPAHAVPRDSAALVRDTRPTALYLASAAAPVAGTAIGALADGSRGAVIGGSIGGAVGLATAVISLTHAGNFVLDTGFPLEIRLLSSIELDERHAKATAPMSNPVERPKCYIPGNPGTPDVMIPGTPGTPPVGDMPGTPETPPTIIPGTPATPGVWHRCS